MSTLAALRAEASDKERFSSIAQYILYTQRYLEFIDDPQRVQAVIVSQNEPHYRFLQYKEDGAFSVTRPLNSRLFYSSAEFGGILPRLKELTANPRKPPTDEDRTILNRSIYTIQQSIGAALDSLGVANKARKINGDLFERLIQLLLTAAGVDCTSGTVKVPVRVPGVAEFEMKFQHDLIIKSGELVKVIGSVKTSSKDRLGKIFVDKFLLHRMTGKDVPHVAIFLNDVQRKGKEPLYGVSATFLPGHFKGYTVKLNPLDGVYYCDIRPNMLTEPILRDHIRTFDRFIFDDLRELLSRDAVVASVVKEEPDIAYGST
jgi:hypothetical protein